MTVQTKVVHGIHSNFKFYISICYISSIASTCYMNKFSDILHVHAQYKE